MSAILQISPQDAYIHIQNGAFLLDVREYDEITELSCNVSNVLIMPMSQFQDNFTQLPKDKEIITICYSGARSYAVTQFLIAKGYSDISNLAGGIIAWKENNLPIK